MPKAKRKSKHKPVVEVEIVEPAEPKPLTEESIYFWTNIPEKLANTVPPSTPVGVSDVLILPLPIPDTFPSLDDFEVPYVREVGIKSCIELFGQHLGCTNYTFDYIQFWLLDVITDCLWRTQDDYFFTKPEQKLVLEWVLYMFRVMRDPTIFFSRKEFFKLFKEAILMAGQLIQEGHDTVPKPDDLFELVLQKSQSSEEISPEETIPSSVETIDSCNAATSESESTFTISKTTSEHIIYMDIGGKERKYVLKRRVCGCEQGSTSSFGTTFTSTMTTTTDSTECVSDEFDLEEEEEAVLEEESYDTYVEPFQDKDYKIFYNVDTKTPARFLPPTTEKKTGFKDVKDDEQGIVQVLDNKEKPHEFIGDVLALDTSSTSTITSTNSSESSAEPIKNVTKTDDPTKTTAVKDTTASTRETVASSKSVCLTEKAINDGKTKMWQEYNLHEMELQDMNDSKIGVLPPNANISSEEKPWKYKRVRNVLKENTEKMLRQMLANMDTEDCAQETCGLGIENKTKNLSILCAIMDLVFDYFYQNFHFTLLKLVLKTNPSVLTQKVNADWSVPKQNLVELVKPKQKPKKKEKKKKKGKKDKKSKKGKDKKSKSSKSKKSKDKKKGKDKKSKKSKKQKPKKLTKEEKKKLKAEQERQRLLQEQQEEEQRKLEENRRCMFPLADAAKDELYMELFENWQKPKEGKEKGKKKGKKGDKKEKKKKKK